MNEPDLTLEMNENRNVRIVSAIEDHIAAFQGPFTSVGQTADGKFCTSWKSFDFPIQRGDSWLRESMKKAALALAGGRGHELTGSPMP